MNGPDARRIAGDCGVDDRVLAHIACRTSSPKGSREILLEDTIRRLMRRILDLEESTVKERWRESAREADRTGGTL